MKLEKLKAKAKKGEFKVLEPSKEQLEDTFKVSTGSLKFDSITGGGLAPGIIRFFGAYEGGKTSAAIEIANNFLDQAGEKGRVLYIKAELRLSYDVQARSTRPFVVMRPGQELEAIDEWSDENIFVYTQNIAEDISSFLYGVMEALEKGERLFIILDSLDWVKRRGDLEAFVTEGSQQPAGVAKYMKEFLRNFGPMITEGGHYFVVNSQVSANIKIDKYAGQDQKEFSAVGGNALMHAADWIFQFKPKIKSAQIKENDNAPADEEKNPIIGNMARLAIIKSTNETTGYAFEYPIKKGSGVWKEREVILTLIAVGAIEKSGSWFTLGEKVARVIEKDFRIKLPSNAKFQGLKNLNQIFEENPEMTKYLHKSLVRALNSGKVSQASILDELDPEEAEEYRIIQEVLKREEKEAE